jgi:twinkle protein
MNTIEKNIAQQWVYNNIFVIDDVEAGATLDGILNKFAQLVKRKGIKWGIIDPYNWIESRKPADVSETDYIGQCLTQIVRFCRMYDFHMFIVAHPTKLQKDRDTGDYEVPTLYSINGSANWFNKAHNGLVLYRKFADNSVQLHVQKVKYRWLGKLGVVDLAFDYHSGIYAEPGMPFIEEYKRKTQFNQQELALDEPPF